MNIINDCELKPYGADADVVIEIKLKSEKGIASIDTLKMNRINPISTQEEEHLTQILENLNC